MKNRKGKSLKSLSRLQLLELLLQTMEENDALKAENEELKRKSENQKLICDKAGSLAEASLALTRIFEEADKAIEIYKSSLAGNCPSQTDTQAESANPQTLDNES